MLGNQFGGAKLAIRQLRMLVDVTPPCDHGGFTSAASRSISSLSGVCALNIGTINASHTPASADTIGAVHTTATTGRNL